MLSLHGKKQRKRYRDVYYNIASRLLKMTFIVKLMTSQTYLFTQDLNRIIFFSCKQLYECYLNLHLKFGAILFQTNKDMTLYPHMYQNVYCNLLQKNFSIQEWPLYKRL